MEKRLLRILRIFYQGFRLIAGRLKEEIDNLEKELNEPVDRAEVPADKS